METTRLSTKGQIIHLKNTRVADRFPKTVLDKVAGCPRSKRNPKTPAQMNTALAREVGRRHERGRY